MEPGSPASHPSDEIARLKAKLEATDDEDIRAALRLKIASLSLELERDVPTPAPAPAESEPVPAPKPERPSVALTEEERKTLQQESKRLARAVDDTDDPDVREALNRRMLQIHLLLEGKPVAFDEVPEAMAEIPATDAAAAAESDRLLREARVEKMRGNTKRADELLSEALRIAPNHLPVLTAVGEERLEAGKLDEAKVLLERARLIDPRNPVVERRLGEIVLRTKGALSPEEQMRLALSDSPFATVGDEVAGRGSATILSIFLPGLGHMVLGHAKRGLTIAIAWVICLALLVWMRKDLSGLMTIVSPSPQSFNPFVFVPLLGAFVIWIGTLGSLGGKAKQTARKREVPRPEPPVNLPFE